MKPDYATYLPTYHGGFACLNGMVRFVKNIATVTELQIRHPQLTAGALYSNDQPYDILNPFSFWRLPRPGGIAINTYTAKEGIRKTRY